MDFCKLKNSDQIYFYLYSWCSAGGILKPGKVFFINSVFRILSINKLQQLRYRTLLHVYIFSSIENVKCCKIVLASYCIFEVLEKNILYFFKNILKNFFLTFLRIRIQIPNPDPDPRT